MSKPQPAARRVALRAIPSCAGSISRRTFCAGAGAGLIALGLPGCDPGGARIGIGGIDGTSPTGSSQGPGASDLAGNHGPVDLAASGGSPDAATPHDLSTGGASCTLSGINAGAAASIASGTALHLSGSGYSLFLCRDANGLYALDALCPHEGKLLTKQTSQFYCSRHGATFDLNGEHPTSPAFSPLDHYALCVDASGDVIIDPNTVVAATTRA